MSAGLVLNFSLCQSCSCKELTFTETTGEWSTSNPGGWNVETGGDNPFTSEAISAVLTVTNNTGTFDIDLYDTFPTSDDDFQYTLTNEDFGYVTGQSIPDQIMTFTYTVTGNDIFDEPYIASQTIYQAFYCNSKCCLVKLLAKIDPYCSTCSEKAKDNYFNGLVLFDGMVASANEGNIVNFNNQLTQMQKLCNNSGCKSCQ